MDVRHYESAGKVRTLRPQEMRLLNLDYGDLLRPEFRILPSRGWGQCTNLLPEYLIVYGPKHPDEKSIFDTSPYVLAPGSTTPDHWDCDGFFLPADRRVQSRWRSLRRGPLAIKFRNYRKVSVSDGRHGVYRCPWADGIFEPSQINWAIPNLSSDELRQRL